MKPRQWWIYKGKSNFCSRLDMDDNFQDIRAKPDGFYDIVCIADTVENGIHVIEYSAVTALEAKLEEATELLKRVLLENQSPKAE